MRISFISPPSEYLYDPFRGDQHCQMQLLTILEQTRDHLDLSLIDLRGVKKEALLYHVPERDLYLHSVYTLDFNQQAQLVAQLREVYPRAKHVAGGPHVNLFPHEVAHHFDVIVRGDAEETICTIVKDAREGNLQKIYEQRAPIDINKYHYTQRHFVPISSTARKNTITVGKEKKYGDLLGTTVVFTRGCPYACHFCAIPSIRSINPKMRSRSPRNIEAEINYLKCEYNIQALSLHDEIGIPIQREQAISRLEVLGRSGMIWKAQCRVDGMTSEIAQLMYESGCRANAFGVESPSQQALDLINKKINVERSKQSIRLLQENGIAARAYMIFGLPGEPENIAQMVKDFLRETRPDAVFLHIFTPRPGTPVYDQRDKYGIHLTDTDWSNNNHLYYDGEEPRITFEYRNPPWGKARSPEKIIGEYKELLHWIKEEGMAPYN